MLYLSEYVFVSEFSLFMHLSDRELFSQPAVITCCILCLDSILLISVSIHNFSENDFDFNYDDFGIKIDH